MNLSIIKYFIYLIIIERSQAKIDINITVASTKGGAKVIFDGADLKLVSEKEVNIYNITDYNLKKSIRIELGKEPDEVFLKDPTDYGNIYNKYKWSEINRNVHVKSAKIEEILNEKVVIAVRNFINNTTKIVKMKVNFHEKVETTIFSYWNKDEYQDDIDYNVNVNYLATKLYFKNKWMDDNFKTLNSLFGVKNLGFVNVVPGSTITSKLIAKRTVLMVKIVYSVNLVGNIVVNYARLYGKYHFWAPTISNIMKAGNLNNELIINEIIEIKCYTDAFLDVIDKNTGNKVPLIFDKKPFRKRKLKKLA